MNGLICLPATVCLGEHATHMQAYTRAPSDSKMVSKTHQMIDYLYYPNESFQLVNVKLQVHAVCQPGADNIHRAGVPLLQERQDFSNNHVRAACCALNNTVSTDLSHQPACSRDMTDLEGETGTLFHTEFPCMSL